MRENETLRAQLAEAESRLAEAQEVIRAIQSGDVDAVVVSGPQGDQVFTLKGAEYAYRVLIEAISEGAATIAADGTVLYCNQRLADLLGIPLEQIIGNPVAKLAAAEAKHVFEALFGRARSGQPGKAELDFQAAQGNPIPVYVSLREMKPVEPAALCMVVTDLRERKKSDELIAAGKLASSILESAAEAIAVCDETGRIFSANQALEDLCGFNPLFQPFEAALPLEVNGEPAGKRFSIFDALKGGTLRAQEVRFLRNSGLPASLLLTSSPIKGSSGVVGCVLTMTDITQRKRAEDELRQNQEWLRVTLTSIGDAVMAADVQGRVRFLNPVAASLTGWQAEEAQGQPSQSVLRIINEVTRMPVEDIVARVLQGGRAVELANHTALLAKDGREIPIEDSAAPILDSAGKVVGVVLVFHDVTEERRKEEALLRSEKLASVGRMAAAIAHEINNPLETIGHALYLASTDPETSQQAKSYLDLAEQELQRVTQITKQTLTFHRERKSPTLVDLRDSVNSILKLFTARLDARGITVEKRYAEVEPIRASGGEIQQVIANLLANSMDAMPNYGKIQLRVSRSIGRNGSRAVRLTIADNGSGMPPERLKQIFEAFFTTKEMIGTGLGLWVTKQIVEKHGATVRVRSKPGRGTVFSIAFPITGGITQAQGL